MKIAVLALTPGGLITARRICRLFPGSFLFCHPRLRGRVKTAARILYYHGELQTLTAALFHYFSAIIFVAATGIAVRMIAPCLQSKKTDPAIIAVDDTGHFAVSLLSGHQGGANDLAEQIAAGIGALPVITTATDRRQILAFDLLARRRGWNLEHAADMKKISAAQLAGKEITIYCDLSFDPSASGNFELPTCSRLVTAPGQLATARHGVVFLSNRLELPSLPPGLPFIIIRPRTIVAGIGCRRGISAAAIITALENALRQAGRVPEGLLALATIELKRDEKGLREAAHKLAVPLYVFSSDEVRKVEHLFSGSPFVQQYAGVGAVAEPCAYLGSSGAEIILEKRAGDGITVALAEKSLSGRLAQPGEGSL